MMRSPGWLSGALIVTTVASDSKQGMKLDLLLRLGGKSEVSIRFMDRNRFELPSEGRISPARINLETSEFVDSVADCELVRRAQAVLGGALLQRSTCTVWLPAPIPPQTAYLSFLIRLPGDSGENVTNASDFAWDRSSRCIYLEAQCRTLGVGKHGARSLFFLTTQQQANDRIESIAKKYRLFERSDEASTDALTNLMLGVIGGGNTPLLTEWLEGDDE